MQAITTTGHAIRDVGLMTLTVFSQRATPADLTEADLWAAADWLRDAYVKPGMLRNHLKGLYLLNAKYSVANDAIREPFIAQVLYGWQQPHTIGVQCAFCGQPALYRATREEMPLLNGRGVINFSAQGRSGLPVCGICSLLVQMALLGCLKSGRGLLLLYTDHAPFLRATVTDALKRSLQAQSLQVGDSWASLPQPRTRFVEQLVRWLRQTQRSNTSLSQLEGYYFSNTGASPFIQIFQMDHSVIQWVEGLLHHSDGAVAEAFRGLLAEPTESAPTERQPFYEDLLTLPADAPRFLRRHLLASFARAATHPTIITTFMEQIMRLTPEYIALLKHLGDRFSLYQGSKRSFFYEFNRAPNFAEFRRVVVRAADDYQRRTQHTLLTMEEFIDAFVPKEDEYNDWRLSRDLITLYLLQTHGLSPDLLDEDFNDDVTDEGDLS